MGVCPIEDSIVDKMLHAMKLGDMVPESTPAAQVSEL
jgi:hypothetical protein